MRHALVEPEEEKNDREEEVAQRNKGQGDGREKEEGAVRVLSPGSKATGHWITQMLNMPNPSASQAAAILPTAALLPASSPTSSHLPIHESTAPPPPSPPSSPHPAHPHQQQPALVPPNPTSTPTPAIHMHLPRDSSDVSSALSPHSFLTEPTDVYSCPSLDLHLHTTHPNPADPLKSPLKSPSRAAFCSSLPPFPSAHVPRQQPATYRTDVTKFVGGGGSVSVQQGFARGTSDRAHIRAMFRQKREQRKERKMLHRRRKRVS